MNRKLVLITTTVYLLFVSLALADSGLIETNISFKIGNGNSSSPKYQFNLNLTDLEGIDQAASIKLYKPSSKNLINTFEVTGNATLSCDDALVDFEIDFEDSDLNILAKNLTVVPLTATTSNVIIEHVDPDVPDFMMYRAYKIELPGSFKFKNVDLKIKYGDLPVDNENNLVLKRCGNFDVNAGTCLENWTDVNETINTTGKYVVATLSGFSVYGIGESENTETTTTTTTTPTTSTTSTTQAAQQQSGSSGSQSVYTSTTSSSRSSSTTTTTPTTTSVKIITSTTSTTSSANTTKSDSFTGMSASIQQNSIYLVIPVLAVVAFLAWRFYSNRKQTAAPKFYRLSSRSPKRTRDYSRNETKLVFS
jgi:hypothetical protein